MALRRAPNTAPRAAIYTRISDDPEGTELGIERQEEDVRLLADHLGAQVVEVFPENDRSASTRSRKARPQFEAMMRRAEAGEFDVLLAYSNSRLTRRPMEWERLITLYERHGVTVHTVASGSADLSRADGRAVARTIAAWDAAEAERIAERVARAARQRAENGVWHGGHVPSGYVAIEIEMTGRNGKPKTLKRLQVDPQRADHMRDAATRLLAGESLYAITNDYNRRGLTTSKGSHWRPQTIRRAMLSPTLAGLRECDGQVYEGEWQPVLDRKTWDRLRELLTADTDANGNPRRFGPLDGDYSGKRALGGGLTVCAHVRDDGTVCGKPLVSARFRGQVRLVCHSQATGGCGGVVIKYDEYEQWLLGLVMERLDSEEWRTENTRTPEVDDRRALLRGDRAELRDERERVLWAFELGMRTEREAQRRVADIDADLASIESRLHDLAADSVLDGITDAASAWTLWKAADVTRRRQFLAALIERVEVSRWPEGMATRLSRRSSERLARRAGRAVESVNEFEVRQAEHHREALRRRVSIRWRR